MLTTRQEQRIQPRVAIPPPVGAAVVLEQFILNRAGLRPFHLPLIDLLAQRIVASWRRSRPIREVTMVGHTDTSGPSPYNLALGRSRAQAARMGLRASMARMRDGLAGKVKILVFSAGATRPAVSNATDEGRARNRRVEIWVGPPPRIDPNLPGNLRWAQRCLDKILGAAVAASGRMDPQTRRALVGFQQRQNLKVTGAFDPFTLNAIVRVCGQLRRPTGPFVTKRSSRTVGRGGDNDQQETRDTMDLLHLLWAISNDHYGREYPLVAGSPAQSRIGDADIPLTIAAIGRVASRELAAPVAQHFLNIGASAPLGAGVKNNKDDVLQLQNVLAGGLCVGGVGGAFETGALLAESNRRLIETERTTVRGLTTPTVPDSMISGTLNAISTLKQAIAGGRLGWSPIHKDESENRGDRFGGRTFDFSISSICQHPGAPESVELFGLSILVPAGVKTTANKVHIFFSPGGVGSPFGDHGGNAVLTHGLRGASDSTDWILISIPGINENGKDGFRTIDMPGIRSCLERVGRSQNVDMLRLSAHSRGGKSMRESLLKPGLITGPINRVTMLDCGEFFNGGMVTGFRARGAGVIHYRVINRNPLAGAEVRNLPRGCMRAIGYSRLIDDARETKPGIAIPGAIQTQLSTLALPERGKLSTAVTPAAGEVSLKTFCASNHRVIGEILRNESNPPSSMVELILRENLLHNLERLAPDTYSHHLFVAEIAHELVD